MCSKTTFGIFTAPLFDPSLSSYIQKSTATARYQLHWTRNGLQLLLNFSDKGLENITEGRSFSQPTAMTTTRNLYVQSWYTSDYQALGKDSSRLSTPCTSGAIWWQKQNAEPNCLCSDPTTRQCSVKLVRESAHPLAVAATGLPFYERNKELPSVTSQFQKSSI